MSIVTSISRQKRVGSNRFNIALDGKYAFTMSDLEVSTSGLRVGQELTVADVEHFSKAATEAKAYALALRFIGVRVRSQRELTDYLTRKGCEPDEISMAIERLEGLGLVDDAQFARSWIADRMAVRPRSRMRLAQELGAKGVARDVIDAALQDIEPEHEIETLKALINRKKRAGGYHDEKKLLGYLQRQGYRWELIKQAMEQLEDSN